MYTTSSQEDRVTENGCINNLALNQLQDWHGATRADKWNVGIDSITLHQEEYSPEYLKVRNKYINISGIFVLAGMRHIDNMLNIMKFPEKWKVEKVAEPTKLCKTLARDVATIIYYSDQLMPVRISPNIEEGITITYHNPEVNRTLIIEAYNDGDIAGLVNQDKTILISQNVIDDKFEELLNVFKGHPKTSED